MGEAQVTINIYAQSEEQVYPSEQVMAVANNMTFFNQCLKRFPKASFSCSAEQEPYLIVGQKSYTIIHQAQLTLQRKDPQLALLFEQILAHRACH